MCDAVKGNCVKLTFSTTLPVPDGCNYALGCEYLTDPNTSLILPYYVDQYYPEIQCTWWGWACFQNSGAVAFSLQNAGQGCPYYSLDVTWGNFNFTSTYGVEYMKYRTNKDGTDVAGVYVPVAVGNHQEGGTDTCYSQIPALNANIAQLFGTCTVEFVTCPPPPQ
jgi:hypothetical protein